MEKINPQENNCIFDSDWKVLSIKNDYINI